MKTQFMQICHSCGKEVLTCNNYWKAQLVDATVYFHPTCYRYYVRQMGNVLKKAQEMNNLGMFEQKHR